MSFPREDSHVSVQEDVWEHVAPMIRSCADGYNACIFAYGQTGSGERQYDLLRSTFLVSVRQRMGSAGGTL